MDAILDLLLFVAPFYLVFQVGKYFGRIKAIRQCKHHFLNLLRHRKQVIDEHILKNAMAGGATPRQLSIHLGNGLMLETAPANMAVLSGNYRDLIDSIEYLCPEQS